MGLKVKQLLEKMFLKCLRWNFNCWWTKNCFSNHLTISPPNPNIVFIATHAILFKKTLTHLPNHLFKPPSVLLLLKTENCSWNVFLSTDTRREVNWLHLTIVKWNSHRAFWLKVNFIHFMTFSVRTFLMLMFAWSLLSVVDRRELIVWGARSGLREHLFHLHFWCFLLY